MPRGSGGRPVPGRRLPWLERWQADQHVRACLVQVKLACAACWPLPETGLIGTGRVAGSHHPPASPRPRRQSASPPGQTPMPDGLGFISPGEMPRDLKAILDQSPARNGRDSRPPVPREHNRERRARSLTGPPAADESVYPQAGQVVGDVRVFVPVRRPRVPLVVAGPLPVVVAGPLPVVVAGPLPVVVACPTDDGGRCSVTYLVRAATWS